MSLHQIGILAPGPSLGRFLFFQLAPGDDPRAAVKAIQGLDVDEDIVVGFGSSLVLATGGRIDGLRAFPSLTGPGIEVPSTQAAAWCWLRGEGDRGQLVHRSLVLEQLLEPLMLSSIVDSFKHDPTPSGREETYPGTKTVQRIRPATRQSRPPSRREEAQGSMARASSPCRRGNTISSDSRR